MMTGIKCIAFDMDDTLLDTSQILVPMAARRACIAMLDHGVASNVDSCLEWRAGRAATLTHKEIFAGFIDKHGIANSDADKKEAALLAAMKAFYNPEIPPRLPLMEGAEENLTWLRDRYKLYLVTSGEPAAQMQKVAALGIESFFEKIYLINNFKDETKQMAFEDILARNQIAPSELLSIGNRLSQEIRYAKICGAQTCYFCYGEHIGEQPERREDYPDVTIYKHSELITACGL